jgi:hypothetical protein
MTDPFSEYVALLDGIEQIPITAREAPRLSAEQRVVVVSQVVALVRDRVLPQSALEDAGLDALLDDGGGRIDGAPRSHGADHDAILAPINELARANPEDPARVQELLYRVHTAIAGHFSEAEVMLAGLGNDEEPSARPLQSGPARGVGDDCTGPSAWFG